MSVLEQFDREQVLYYFEELTKIPHGSGNEKAISDYIVNFAKERGLFYAQDDVCNVCVKKAGTFGLEQSPAIIIQGHLDMVCEKNSGVEHDFQNDPLDIYVENDFIHARGTTLGADNGIAVAYMLALLNGKDLVHPPIEAVFTVEEETGLDGAKTFDTSILEGKMFLNMDTEEEGVLLAGCAGGLRTRLHLPLERVSCNEQGYALTIRGLKGGHSGADIHLGRANADCLMGRILDLLDKEVEYDLVSVNGGTMDNAICREAEAVLVLHSDCPQRVREILVDMEEMLLAEYGDVDAGISLGFAQLQEDVFAVLTEEIKRKIICTLTLLPYGVMTMSADMEGLVESSNNIGIVKTLEDSIFFDCAMRSSVASRKDALYQKVCAVSELVGGELEIINEYPGWRYNPNSKLTAFFGEIYEKMYDKKPRIEAIHAGLECGLFAEKINGLDMISIGPEMYDVHTPDERLSISSTMRVWDFVKEVLANLK